MYHDAVVEEALRLAKLGLTTSEVSRRTGAARSTVREWRRDGVLGARQQRRSSACWRCDDSSRTNPGVLESAYAYTLAMYLGDGSLSRHRRDVYRLRVTLDNRYPEIISECARHMGRVMPGRRVLIQPRRQSDCSDVGCYSKHWPCLLPQHGSGTKHKRSITLQPWQEAIVERQPEQVLRGFIHSDGTRHLNRVNGRDYPRYMFSNRSSDLQRLFCDACDRLDIHWTQSYRWTISVARSAAVARLDSFIGPKR